MVSEQIKRAEQSRRAYRIFKRLNFGRDFIAGRFLTCARNALGVALAAMKAKAVRFAAVGFISNPINIHRL